MTHGCAVSSESKSDEESQLPLSHSAITSILNISKSKHEGVEYSPGRKYFDYYLLGVLSQLVIMPEFSQACAEKQTELMVITLGSGLFDHADATDEELYINGFGFDVVHSLLTLSTTLISRTPEAYINWVLLDSKASIVKKACIMFELKHYISLGDRPKVSVLSEQLSALTRHNINQ
jgi:hypothetical protein